MKENVETRFYYFVPYKRNSKGYTRLCHAVSTLPDDKTVQQFVKDLMVIPEYRSVEFFEVFYRNSDEWSKLCYFDTFRVVDFEDCTINFAKNLFV